MSYFAKLTGEDLSRYLNKTELYGLRKAYVGASLQNVKMFTFPALHHDGHNSWQRWE